MTRHTTLQPKAFQLTPREEEILEWVARGKTNAEVGRILDIHPQTAAKHLNNIYVKFGVETRTAAVVCWLSMLQE